MIEKSEFIDRINALKTFQSTTGSALYSDLKLTGSTLTFTRENTGQIWKLNLDEAYKAYTKESYLNTVVIRNYVKGRVYSPALGLLMATGLCDKEGNRKMK